MTDNRLQQIRKKLYLLRDGASSSSMREKGLEYKLNWGVQIPALRQLAAAYFPDEALAAELWKQQTRELRILATLIQDPTTFTAAEEWMQGINTIELAEQTVMNLFSKMPGASSYASEWIRSESEYMQLTGFLLYTRLFMTGTLLNPEEERIYFSRLFKALNTSSLSINHRALNSLLYLIRTDSTYINKVNALLATDTDLDPELKDSVRQAIEAELNDD